MLTVCSSTSRAPTPAPSAEKLARCVSTVRSPLFEVVNSPFLIKCSTATPNFVHLTQFALDVKAKTLPIYEKVFDIEYPLPKLDTLVASDFDAGKATPPLLDPPKFLPVSRKALWKTG